MLYIVISEVISIPNKLVTLKNLKLLFFSIVYFQLILSLSLHVIEYTSEKRAVNARGLSVFMKKTLIIDEEKISYILEVKNKSKQ